MKTHRFGSRIGTSLVVLALAVAGSSSVGAAITSPLDIPGHVLWLDGNDVSGTGAPAVGGPIGAWADKSAGLGDNTVVATGGAPTEIPGARNGNAVVGFAFNSVDKLDNAAFNLSTGNYSVFTVVSPSGGGRHVLSGIDNGATDAVLYTNGNSWRFYDGVGTDGVDQEISPQHLSDYHLFGYQIDPVGDLGFFDDAVTTGHAWGAAPLGGLRIGNVSRIGAPDLANAEAWGGEIAEVIIYDRSLSAGEQADLKGYLGAKWNISAFALASGDMTELETGGVTGGAPSTLLPSVHTLGLANVALASAGGVAFAQDEISAPYGAPLAINGLYASGPDFPWIGLANDTFVGVKLSGPTTIEKIGFQNHYPGRRDGTYMFQYTTDSFAGIAGGGSFGLNPAQAAALDWLPLDVKEIVDAADTRHLYGFDPIENVTGVRLVLQASGAQIGIAELEVWAPLPGDQVVVETIDTVVFDPTANPDSFNFPSIGRPSDADYADQNSGNGVVVSVAPGSALGVHGNSAAVTVLNDGVIMDGHIDCCNDTNINGPNQKNDAFFFADVQQSGRILMTFPELADVEKVVTFAGIDDCCLNRGYQNYALYGSTAETPDTFGDLATNGDWQRISTVATVAQNQTAVEITSSGGSLGIYRHLLWEVFTPDDNAHDFYGEFDVYAAPIPEPSTLALAVLALFGLCFSARRRR